jgi:hypothetical protein
MMLDKKLTTMYLLHSTAGSPITRSKSRKHSLKTPRVQGRNKRKQQREGENPDEFSTGILVCTEIDITAVIHFTDKEFDVSHCIYIVFDLEAAGF